MSPFIWLFGAVVAGIAAYLVGWPAWGSYRSREARDLNAERYLAWRGRAPRATERLTREGMTGEERRRIWAGAALGVLAVICLLAFFTTT